MASALFYKENLSEKKIQLDEDTSKHVVQVLRMKEGDGLMLTDGKGKKVHAIIMDDNRKRCMVSVQSEENMQASHKKISIAISLTKNNTRFEWFLEKATEIGVSEIYPLLCERTAKEKFRFDRMKGILVSAMLQSQQAWLPVLHEPSDVKNILQKTKQAKEKYIAHCIEEEKKFLAEIRKGGDALILIGPEGDFTPAEIESVLAHDFQPVSLGNTRLRTETAGLVAAVLLSAT